MNVGISMCGSSKSALFADTVIDTIKQWGINPVTISMSSVSALSIYSNQKQEIFQSWKDKTKIREYIDNCDKEIIGNVAINAVDIKTSKSTIFWKDGSTIKGNIEITNNYSLKDALYASICPSFAIRPYKYEDKRLCDISSKYGCPYFPLALSAVDKIIAVTFLPRENISPYILATNRLIEITSSLATVSIKIIEPKETDFEKYKENILNQLKLAEEKAINRIVFY